MTARPSAFDAIAAQLRRIRRRLRLRAGLAGAGWTLAIVAGLALPGLLAFSVGLPVAWGVLVVLMAGLVALYRTVWRPWRLARADETVAAHVEAAEPMLRDGLLASVQFGREWPTPGRGSKEMAALLAEKVAGQLDALDPSTIGPLAPLRPGWLATAAVAAVWVIAGFVLGEPLSRGWAALTFADDAAGPRETGPLVGDLTLTLNFPPHTHREARVVPNSTGDLEVPKGTRVQLSAVTLSPAREVSLVFGEAAMPLRLSEGRDVTGEFVVSAPTVWRFAMTDAKGHALREGVERRLRIEPDQPPTVTLQYPDQDLELDDLRAVPVAFEARDDFGLSEVAVVIALAADPEHPERIVREGVKGARFADDDTVDLSVINAKPGDRLLLFVEALDNNGVDGPQRGVSATRTITVFSPQAAHFELTERLRRTVEVLLDALADRLELVWRGVEAPPLSKRLADVRVSTREAAAALEGVVDAMADDPLTPDEVRLALTGRLGALEEATEAEKTLVEPAGAALDAGEDAVIRAASRANDAVVEQLEQAIILVEAMVARLALEDMAAMAEELKAAREELRALIDAYRKDPNNEALKGRIMRDIERLRARMREMQARMAQLRQKLPEEFLNLDGLKQDDVAKGLDSTQKQLDDLEKMLDEGRIDEALAALDEMEQSLNELSASLDKDMQDLQDETNPEMQRAISELMDQTRDLMKRQEKLSADTQQLAEARDAAQQKAMEQEFAEQMKAIEENAAAMQRTIERMAAEDKPMMAEEDVEHLLQRADEIQRALRGRQLMEALEMAERAMDNFENLGRFERFEPRSENFEKLGQRGQAQDQEVIRGLAELIEKARQRADESVSPQQAEAMRQQQRGLAEAARQLQQRIERNGERVPGLGDQPMQRAQQAEQSMEQAARELGRGRPSQARPGQEDARSQLESLMEGLRQAAKPQRADRRDGQGRRPLTERVRIPGADEHEAPAEFRQELLDAMKQKPSEAYREQVKRYYESLIR